MKPVAEGAPHDLLVVEVRRRLTVDLLLEQDEALLAAHVRDGKDLGEVGHQVTCVVERKIMI